MKVVRLEDGSIACFDECNIYKKQEHHILFLKVTHTYKWYYYIFSIDIFSHLKTFFKKETKRIWRVSRTSKTWS